MAETGYGLEQRLDALIDGLHKQNISSVEIHGELKLLKQQLQSAEVQRSLENQSTNIRLQKLEQADQHQTAQMDDMKKQINRAGGAFTVISVLGMAVVGFVQALFLKGWS